MERKGKDLQYAGTRGASDFLLVVLGTRSSTLQ